MSVEWIWNALSLCEFFQDVDKWRLGDLLFFVAAFKAAGRVLIEYRTVRREIRLVEIAVILASVQLLL